MPRKTRLVQTSAKALIIVALTVGALTAAGQETRKRLSSPQPSYPELARRMGLSSVVKIELVVGADGEIKESKVVGGHPVLAEAALKALREWKYERSRSESKIEIEFRFHS